MKTNKQSGFTLVELAIVLVIIGLIVGGVLVGQDLIKAAQIRSTVGQLEKYDAAVNTFRGKYNGLPGDLANCSNFFSTASDCPSGGVVNNGALEDTAGTKVLISGETTAFWRHMYLANLIADPVTNGVNTITAAGSVVAPGTALPAAKIGRGNYISALSGGPLTQPGFAGTLSYRIFGITATTAGVPTITNALTPLEAFQVDTKKDDGVPNTGVVQITDHTTGANYNTALDVATTAATACLTAADTYNTASTTYQNSPLCQVLARGSF